MRRRMQVAVLGGAMLLTACTASGPVQREMGTAARLELTNNTSTPLDLELVAGTTGSELQQDDVIARVTLSPGERTKVMTYPGRYTLFPHHSESLATRGLAFNGIRLQAHASQTVTIGERTQQTFTGPARRLIFQAS